MTSRIFRSIMLASFTVLILAATLILGVMYGYLSEESYTQLANETRIVARGVERDGVEFFDDFSIDSIRITLIGPDGSVLYDSEGDVALMENHFEREEFREAIQNGEGSAKRTSQTLSENRIYYAKRLEDSSVLRLSSEQTSFFAMIMSMLYPIIIIMVAIAVGALLLAMRLSKKIVEPLNNVDIDAPLDNEGYSEIEPLLRKIDAQQRKIREQKKELSMRKKEFAAVADKMSDGLVLLLCDGKIISINSAALDIFGVESSCEGKEFESVCNIALVHSMINEAKEGKKGEQIVELSDKGYRFSASPVHSGDSVTGIVLLVHDVTDEIDAEKMRREFTANVSHELKTPLQTISGCAELLSNGMVKGEDVAEFSANIYSEAQRMITLVADIISLSHLEEGTIDNEREVFDLYALVNEVVDSLLPQAQKHGVSLEASGSAVEIFAIRRLVSVIAHNLCDNAIKYNRENGSVNVRVFRENEDAVLYVSDSGIGIPKEDIEHIFERFYRVDKSRSKKVGGTGLGLSIVKHAAKLNGATLFVDSTVGKGTAITVRFKAK